MSRSLRGEIIVLRQNANISTGGIGKDVTEEVDSNLKDLAVKAAKAIGMSITGVDILYDRLSNQAYVLELNDCPGIDIHHFPVTGKPHDVAKDVIDFLFKKKRKKTMQQFNREEIRGKKIMVNVVNN